MNTTNNIAVIGFGPSGSLISGLLKGSVPGENNIAVDDNPESLNASDAGKKILVSPGKPFTGEISLVGVNIVFMVLDPSEGNSLTYAQAVTTAAMQKNTYSYAFLIKPPGGWTEDDKGVYRSFDGAALIDIDWIEKKREKGHEDAARIGFNFLAHSLGFIAGGLESGKIGLEGFKTATAGKLAGFAATSVSRPDTLMIMTMSSINASRVRSAILFLPDTLDNLEVRRIFLGVSAMFPDSQDFLSFRVPGVEPFRIFTMLMTPI